MADLQISLKYSTPAQRVGFWSMCAFTPVWALLVPLVLGAFISFVLQNPTPWNSYMPMGIILFLFGLMVFGIVGTANLNFMPPYLNSERLVRQLTSDDGN